MNKFIIFAGLIIIVGIVILVLSIKRKLKKNSRSSKNDSVNDEKEQSFQPARTELFQILKVKDAEDLSLEKQKSLSTVIMNINTDKFTELLHKMKTEELFSFINCILEKIIPIIYKEKGIVDNFADAGLTAFFLQEQEHALTAAVSVSEVINEMGAKQKEYNHFSIGICYGTVMVGVVGHTRRMSPLTISEYTGLSEWLQFLGRKYYAGILVTGTFIGGISDFDKKFNGRFLGYIYIESRKAMEKVYDVFDGDRSSVRNKKRQTKMLFETGVDLFVKQNFTESRLCFIEVLKTDRFDKAAKEYVYLCDRYRNKRSSKNIPISIEVYG